MKVSKRHLLIYVIVTGLCLVLLIELAVRMTRLAPPLATETGNMVAHPYLPFMPKPNTRLSGRSRYDEFDYEIEINSFGFRDFDRPAQKPDGVFRIFGLGDSTTYGGGALFEETYLRRLEILLNERPGEHPEIEIVKAGIPGYYPEPERMLLEHFGPDFAPDLITLGFGTSDVIDTLLGLEAIRIGPTGRTSVLENQLGPVGLALYRHSHAARIILNRYLTARLTRPTDWDEIFRANGKYEAQWQQIETELSRIAALGRELGADLIILYIPDFTVLERGEERLYPPARLHAWADANGAGFVDATAALLEASNDSDTPLYWPRDRHPTPAAYRIIADTLYRYLLDHAYVP